ncbi:MAG: phosphotransferase family protein [Phycisphaerae bacterium]
MREPGTAVSIELPDDAVLGDLRSCFQPAAVLDACREQLRRIGRSERDAWRDCRMVEALYHPQRYARVAYALLDSETIPAQRFWPQGRIVYLHTPPRRPVSRRGDVLTIAGRSVEVYCFPNDRRLRNLRKFQNRADATRWWKRWLDETGDDFRIDRDSLRRVLIRYVPEQKWIIRLRARGIDPVAGAAGKRSVAVRAALPQSCEMLWRRHRRFATAAGRTLLPFTVPDVAGADLTRGLLATRWLRGDSLFDALRTGSVIDLMPRVARALAAFHEVRCLDIEPLVANHVLARIDGATADLSAACPERAVDLARVRARLQRRLSELPPVKPVTLHNDFHWNQVRVQGDRLAILDLERLCLGDPLIDVANFDTQVRMLGHRPECDVDASTAAGWANAFFEAWGQRSHVRIDPDTFACYAALSLLELARGMMRHLRPGWRALAHRCIEAADARLAGAPHKAVMT